MTTSSSGGASPRARVARRRPAGPGGRAAAARRAAPRAPVRLPAHAAPARALRLTFRPPPARARRFLEGTLDENVVWANWSAAAQRERVARLRAMEAAQGATPPGVAEIDAMLARLAAPPAARSMV